MRKLALALVCLVSVAFFASCDDPIENPEPTIYIITGADYITGTIDNPQVIDFEDPTMWKYGFHVESNPETKQELASLKVHYVMPDEEGTSTYDTIVDLTGMTSYDFVESVYEEAKDIIYALEITATVTDAAGETKTANIAFKIDWEGTLEPETFLWNRHGAADATGLEQFGLKWTRNGAKVDYAIIEPMEGAMLYTFQPEVWDETETIFQKYALFGEMPVAVASFKGVSAWASSDYDFVIGSYYEDEYYLIHITHAEVSSFKGTDITITGEWK